MNKLQELSTTATDAPTLAGLIDSGNIADAENHARTQERLDEILSRMPKTVQTAVPMYIGGVKLSREYYNLFVVGAEKFDKGVFQIDKNRSLVEYIDPKVKKKFFNIRDDAVVEKILTLPSLFMAENADYMRSRTGAKAILGIVTNLEILPTTIEVSFEPMTKIFQQSITDISAKLALPGNPGISELNHTHWTIKPIDLIAVLTENGLLAPDCK